MPLGWDYMTRTWVVKKLQLNSSLNRNVIDTYNYKKKCTWNANEINLHGLIELRFTQPSPDVSVVTIKMRGLGCGGNLVMWSVNNGFCCDN